MNIIQKNKNRAKGLKIRQTVVLWVFLLLAGTAAAQELTVRGTVHDSKTGEAVPFANVGLMRATDTVYVRGTSTDMEGHFSITAVKAGQYLLHASCVGYEPLVKDLNGLKDLNDINVALQPGKTLDEVKIVAERPLYVMDGEKNMYNTREDATIQTGTASDALQNAPGVEVDAEGNITLRGVSSVEIWINDRPSHMNEEALKQYIKTLPAGAIDRIEVITNPSARYSTSGGVINIVTNQRVTRNELLCLGVRARTSPNVSPWLSYVWANERVDVNLYVNADHAQHHSYEDGTSTLLDPATGAVSRYQSHHDTTISRNTGGYTGLNLNWQIADRTTLSAWAGAFPYWGRSQSSIDMDYLTYNPLRDLGYRYTHRNDDGMFWGGYGGLWLEHRFDTTGRKLSVSANGNTWNYHGTSRSTYVYHDPLLAALDQRDSSLNTNLDISMEVDYIHPLGSGWEAAAGLSADMGTNRETEMLDTLAAGTWRNIALRSIDEAGGSNGVDGYFTLQKRWGGLTVKAGLRGEWERLFGTDSYGDGSGAQTTDTHFFTPVPSLHVSYQTKNFTSYSISYTRRHETPGFSQLSPFVRYSEYSYSTGNPNLLLHYSHNLEAAFNKFITGFGNIGLEAYWRANTNEVGSMAYAGLAPAYFADTQLVNYTRPENIGSSHTEGLEANITYRPTAMLNVRLNASVFNYGYTYQGYSDSRWSWSARLNVWTKLWNRLEVFANAHYSSPRLGLYSLSVANKGVDFGVSSDFFERKLSLYLNVNDIFGMAQWGENSTAPNYQTTGTNRYDSRYVSLGLTWRIGKMELESKARQGATESTPNMN